MTKTKVLMMLALSTMLFVCCGNDDDDGDSGEDTNSGYSLDVTYNDDTQSIDISSLATTKIGETDVVLLATIVAEFDPAPALDSITLNFEGSDGWMPGNSSKCVDSVPADGSSANHGGVDMINFDLVWDEMLGLPGCMGVSEIAVIHIADL